VNILLSCNLSIALSNCKLFCSIEATTTLTHRDVELAIDNIVNAARNLAGSGPWPIIADKIIDFIEILDS